MENSSCRRKIILLSHDLFIRCWFIVICVETRQLAHEYTCLRKFIAIVPWKMKPSFAIVSLAEQVRNWLRTCSSTMGALMSLWPKADAQREREGTASTSGKRDPSHGVAKFLTLSTTKLANALVRPWSTIFIHSLKESWRVSSSQASHPSPLPSLFVIYQRKECTASLRTITNIS